MKLTTASANSSARPAADAEAASKLWHPALKEFTSGVEVREMLESIPGELLELFQASQAAGKR